MASALLLTVTLTIESRVNKLLSGTYGGTYGGPEGKKIHPNEAVVWGFYNIPVCPQQPLVIQYEHHSAKCRSMACGSRFILDN